MKSNELQRLEEYKAHLLRVLEETESSKLKEVIEEEIQTIAAKIVAQEVLEASKIKRLEMLYTSLQAIVNYTGKVKKSDDWATGHGINNALNQILGDWVHIIHPDQSSIYSPASSKQDNALEGAINYAKNIGGFYSDKDLIANGLIHQDGGDLKKPIIMIINTSTIEVSSETDTLTEGGTHWHSCVVLPKNYVTPFGVELNNNQEIVFYLDSLNTKPKLPKSLKHLLTQGTEYTFESEGKEHKHRILPVFSDAKIVDGNECNQQLEGYDCGWWAVYNALMVVFTGNVNYLKQFESPSREPAYALREILPKLEERQVILVESKEKEKEVEKISTDELAAIQHAIYSSIKDINSHKKRKREVSGENIAKENESPSEAYTIQKRSRQQDNKLQRRLDSLARLLQLNSECSAVCFDGEKILIASNEFFIGSKDSNFKKQLNNIMYYLSEVANGRIDQEVRNKIFKEICIKYIKQEAKKLPNKGFAKAIATLAEHVLSLPDPMELRNYSINQLSEIGGTNDSDFIIGAILGGASIAISRLATDLRKIEQELVSYISQNTAKAVSTDIVDAFKRSHHHMIMRSNGSIRLITGQPELSYLSVKPTGIKGEVEAVTIDKQEGTEFGYALLHYSNGYNSKMRGDKNNLHAELQILQALIDNDIKGEINIGVSKLCCPECSCAILAAREVWGGKATEGEGLEVTETIISEGEDKGINVNYTRLVALFRDHHSIFTSANWVKPYFLSMKKEKNLQASKIFNQLLTQLKIDIEAANKGEHYSMYPPDSSSSAPSDIEIEKESIIYIPRSELNEIYSQSALQTIMAKETKFPQVNKEGLVNVKDIIKNDLKNPEFNQMIKEFYNRIQEISDEKNLKRSFKDFLLQIYDSKLSESVNFFAEVDSRGEVQIKTGALEIFLHIVQEIFREEDVRLNRQTEEMRVDESPSLADDEKSSPFSSPYSAKSPSSSPHLTKLSQEREQNKDNSKGLQ
ncbi:hypothetical protein [Candidatus Jidaibacter acanthamoebae]|uniref:hypothetical protein n=1 Tax=Candidatus Jidaibacter acanthamoebae TaxID=86105 RepID=UPI00057D2657|nr:hypothetical protein [Candidatus Jidaibacter acanthamoeba]